jgi:hypothetical protein
LATQRCRRPLRRSRLPRRVDRTDGPLSSRESKATIDHACKFGVVSDDRAAGRGTTGGGHERASACDAAGRVEVSRLYYDWRAGQLPPGANVDLRFETIRERLDLPRRAEHDAFNDALIAAMMYLRLKGGRRSRA